MELPRQRSHQHSKHHRKRLWCPYCKIEINHIECKNEDDIYEFKMKYLDGDYIEEAQESITFLNKGSVING